MNKEIKKKWLKALKSGDYKKGKYTLNRVRTDGDHEYCCLGVLCELAANEGIVESAFVDSTHIGYIKVGDSGEIVETAVLPMAVAAWAGLDTRNPSLPGSSMFDSSLAVLNDYTDTFEEVIEAVKKNF